MKIIRYFNNTIQRNFCQQYKPLKSGYTAGKIATKILSLSNQQIAQLNTLQNYFKSTKQIQLDNLQNSLKYMYLTRTQLKEKYPYSINLEIFILNRISIILKMLSKGSQFIETLQQVYLMSVSLRGYKTPDNLRHLKNLYLAIINYQPQIAEAFVQYLDTQMTKFPSYYRKQLLILSSIVYCMKQQTLSTAMKNLTQVQTLQDSQKILYYNNLSWISLWLSSKSKKDQIKMSLEQSLKLLKDALEIAQFKDKNNQMFHRQKKQELLREILLNQSISVRFSEGVKSFQLVNRNSHILCMNIGQIYYYCQNYEEASFWLQLSIQTAKVMNDFPRIVRGMPFMAKILQQTGFDEQAQKIYVNSLQNGDALPKYSRKFILESYTDFLQKRQRYYESKEYGEQLSNFQQDLRSKLQNILLPDYDFSY